MNGDIQGIKRRLSPLLLRLPGVSGVGSAGGKLAVYLSEDSERVRRDVAAVVEAEAPDTSITYILTGTFRPH
jgi:hypothetical protein